jgi:Fe-S-cluster containining protein
MGVGRASFKSDGARAELLELYAEADRLLASHSCASSTDCCHFGRTGREPYPTAVEVAEVELAVGRAGGASALPKSSKTRNRLPILPVLPEERRCPLLASDGRCRIYESRPFGCRTFFCDRAVSSDGRKMPRDSLQDVGRRIAALSARAFARDPGPRTLESAVEKIRRGESVLVDRVAFTGRRR